MPLNQDWDRFWDKIIISGNRGCWVWQGYLNHKGYGRFKYKGSMWLAHRFSYTYLVGPIPTGLQIDHLCRNPSCVNPKHLEPVTQSENAKRGLTGNIYHGPRKQDHWLAKNPKKRAGEKNPMYKLSSKEVGRIQKLSTQHTQKEIAFMFGVNQSTVSRIISGKRRKYDAP